MMKHTLDELRIQIDAIDVELIDLLQKRMQVVQHVGVYKKAHALPPRDVARWEQVIDTVTREAKKRGLPEEQIRKIWDCIHSIALQIEKSV